jgi:hypothetical protein
MMCRIKGIARIPAAGKALTKKVITSIEALPDAAEWRGKLPSPSVASTERKWEDVVRTRTGCDRNYYESKSGV